jgi:hypothetical protein
MDFVFGQEYVDHLERAIFIFLNDKKQTTSLIKPIILQ